MFAPACEPSGCGMLCTPLMQLELPQFMFLVLTFGVHCRGTDFKQGATVMADVEFKAIQDGTTRHYTSAFPIELHQHTWYDD